MHTYTHTYIHIPYLHIMLDLLHRNGASRELQQTMTLGPSRTIQLHLHAGDDFIAQGESGWRHRSRIHTHKHTNTQTHKHAQPLTHTHTHTLTHTHTYTHTHAHTQLKPMQSKPKSPIMSQYVTRCEAFQRHNHTHTHTHTIHTQHTHIHSAHIELKLLAGARTGRTSGVDNVGEMEKHLLTLRIDRCRIRLCVSERVSE